MDSLSRHLSVLTLVALATSGTAAKAQSIAEVLVGRSVPDGISDFCFDLNRGWAETSPIPAAYPWNSEYVEQADEVSEKLRDIIWAQDAPANVRRFLMSFMDLGSRDDAGLEPLIPALGRIDALQGRSDFAVLIASFNRSHKDLVPGVRFPTPTPFFIDVWPDPRDSRRQLARLSASGLGLPDRSYYLDPDSDDLRTEYEAHIAKTFAIAGFANARQMAARALMVETAIAQAQGELADVHDGGKGAQVFALDELAQLAPEFDWPAFFDNAGLLPTDEILVMQPQYVRDVSGLLAGLALDDSKAYLRWQLLHRYSPFLSSQFDAAQFDFYGRVVQGISEPAGTRQLAQTYVEAFFATDLSDEYVRRFVSAGDRAAAQTIAEDVRAAYLNRLQATSWLSESARGEAVRKLNKLLIGMLYPDQPSRPAPIELSASDLPDNLMRLSQLAYALQLQRLRRPTQRDAWWDAPISVSGAYSVSANALIITAARAASPLFDVAADDPENYGGLGTLVGHEMGHALDDRGSQYDADGELRSWWSDGDRVEFEQRTSRLAEQYSRVDPLPGLPIDGRTVLSESIADLSGLSAGFDALKIALGRKGRAVSTDDERRFFEAWARRWRVQYTQPLLTRVLKSDTHPPLQYRCSIPLSNFDPFYAVIGMDSDNPFYLPPGDRVSIW